MKLKEIKENLTTYNIIQLVVCIIVFITTLIFVVDKVSEYRVNIMQDELEIKYEKELDEYKADLMLFTQYGIYTKGSNTQLVNRETGLSSDYVPEDLVEVPLDGTQITYLRQEASDALVELFTDAQAAENTLLCASGYRSYEEQSRLYEQAADEAGSYEAVNDTAPPGHSEHQLGLAMDVTSESVDHRLAETFGETAEGQWIAENCYKYGFIIRYPKDKIDATGYIYEPWHLRYVGKDVAGKIYESGLCYEEYLDLLIAE